MRTKTRTTAQLKPGMVIKTVAFDSPTYDPSAPLLDAANRVVASNTKPTPWAERHLTFTDGTSLMTALGWSYEVVRGKAARNAAKARASRLRPTGGEFAMLLLGGYAVAA